MTREPRPWILLRAEYERLLSLKRRSNAGSLTKAERAHLPATRALLEIVEARLAEALEQAAE